MKKVCIIILAAITAVLFASCGETQTPAPTPTKGAAIKVTGREAQGDDGDKIKEETVEIKSKKTKQATEPKDPTEPTTAKKKKKNKTLSNLPTQGDVNPNPPANVTTAPNGSFSDADLKFFYKDSYISLNDSIEKAEKILGEDIGADELSGNKTSYDYDGVTIVTYQSGDNEKIEQITVTADTIVTKKGAKVGMYGTQLRKVYGIPNTKSDTAYVYSKGNKSLTFNLQNNVVASYTYNLKH